METNVIMNIFSAYLDGGAFYIKTPTIELIIWDSTTLSHGSAKNGGCFYMSTTTVAVTANI